MEIKEVVEIKEEGVGLEGEVKVVEVITKVRRRDGGWEGDC